MVSPFEEETIRLESADQVEKLEGSNLSSDVRLMKWTELDPNPPRSALYLFDRPGRNGGGRGSSPRPFRELKIAQVFSGTFATTLHYIIALHVFGDI